MSALQRFRDWRHERRIAQLSAASRAAYLAGDKGMAREHWMAMNQAMRSRSIGQVARMERERFNRMSEHDKATFLKHGGWPGSM